MIQLVKNHLEKIEQELTTEQKDKLCSAINGLSKVRREYSFDEIICSKPNELREIIDDIGVMENPLPFMPETYKHFASRKGRVKYAAIHFVENLKITVCPYCNRSYIQTVKRDNGKNARTCQLDHFYPKDKYPYLALSFFNLVPSCYACNHQKGPQSISVSPYQDFKPDELLTFGYKYTYNERTKRRNFEIISNFSQKQGLSLTTNFEAMGLNELYKNHGDIIQEILKKRDLYSPDYIQSLLTQFPELIESEEEAMRLVIGNYVLEEDLGKRPLAKLTRDIAIEVKLITK